MKLLSHVWAFATPWTAAIFQARVLEWGARKALALTKFGSNTKFRSPFQLFFFFFLRRNCSLSTHAYTWSRKYSQLFSRFQFSLLSLLLDETPFLLMSFIYSGSWWWTRKPGMQQSMGSQRVLHDWATELNWFTLLMVSYHFDDFGIRIQVSLLRAFLIILGNSKNISEATTFVSQFYTFSTQISFFFSCSILTYSFLVTQQYRICLQCRRPGFDPWVRKILWRMAWQSTPVFLPGESHRQRNLVGYSPLGFRVGHDWSDLACRHIATSYTFTKREHICF